MKLNDIKVGETVTDGWKTYVRGRDYQFHYIGSGNHANYFIADLEAKLAKSN